MPRGRGQIPPYGKNFRLVSLPYTTDKANRAYVSKLDKSWFIRSDKTSEHWTIYLRTSGHKSIEIAGPFDTFTIAMRVLLDGFNRGCYNYGVDRKNGYDDWDDDQTRSTLEELRKRDRDRMDLFVRVSQMALDNP